MVIYVTSDLHLFHNRDFIYEPRGFNSTYEMSEAILKNWNTIVKEDDDVYVLGDLMLNDDVAGLKLLKQLNGRIHIAFGNHDTDSRIENYLACHNVVEVNIGYRIKYNGYTFIMSHYPTMVGNFNEPPFKKKVVNLAGHCHTKDKFLHKEYGVYHIELDAHNMKPILLDDVINDIKDLK